MVSTIPHNAKNDGGGQGSPWEASLCSQEPLQRSLLVHTPCSTLLMFSFSLVFGMSTLEALPLRMPESGSLAAMNLHQKP